MIHDNKHWELFCRLDWRLKNEAPAMTLHCENCKGTGEVSGPKCLEPSKCHLCEGRGSTRNPELEEKPTHLPDGLHDWMKKAFHAYFAVQEQIRDFAETQPLAPDLLDGFFNKSNKK